MLKYQRLTLIPLIHCDSVQRPSSTRVGENIYLQLQPFPLEVSFEVNTFKELVEWFIAKVVLGFSGKSKMRKEI